MVDFNNLPKYHNLTCQECGQQDRGPEGSTKCTQCRLYESHPELAPGYFTWTKTANGWAASAKWGDKNPEPEPGTVITVHRKNGSVSQHTVREIRNVHYDIAANRVITVDVD